MGAITTGRTRVHYEVEGDGPALVLVHGFSDSLEGWREYGYTETLSATHRLVIIDALGHGASPKPHDPSAYALEQLAADAVAVLDDLDIARAHFLGYSLGGWTGYGVAAFAPERLASVIIGGAQPYGQSMERSRRVLARGLDGWAAVVTSMLGELSPGMKRRLFANDVETLRAVMADDRPDVSARLAATKLPFLLYAGNADPLHPLVERAAVQLPDATFASLPGLNHMQAGVDSDAVLPHVTAFLDRHARTPA